MIISHKYKYIFICPRKVASSSVEYNLVKTCGEQDIITRVPQGLENVKAKVEKRFNAHPLPSSIKEYVGKDVWKSYFKFTIVRNPYDFVVSMFWWETKKNSTKRRVNKYLQTKDFNWKKLFNPYVYIRALGVFVPKYEHDKGKPRDFETFVKSLPPKLIYPELFNTQYYFNLFGRPRADFYIRLENLQEDYKNLCEHLGMHYEPIPRLNANSRPKDKHYTSYYNDELKKLVSKKFKKEINYFGYKFTNE